MAAACSPFFGAKFTRYLIYHCHSLKCFVWLGNDRRNYYRQVELLLRKGFMRDEFNNNFITTNVRFKFISKIYFIYKKLEMPETLLKNTFFVLKLTTLLKWLKYFIKEHF